MNTPPPPCCDALRDFSSTRRWFSNDELLSGDYVLPAEVQWVPNAGYGIGVIGIKFCPWCGSELPIPEPFV